MKQISILISFLLVLSSTTFSQKFEWAKHMGGNGGDRGYYITSDHLGNIYTTGSFRNTVDFDPGSGILNLIAAGLSDIFIQKLDSSGNLIWAKQFGGTGFDEGLSITVDSLENVYTIGIFDGTADFDPGVGTMNLTTVGDYDVFIQKLDASGNFLWVKQLGGSDFDYGYSIAVDPSGHIYTTGLFKKTVDFDPGPGITNLTSAGLWDIFIQKLDSSGNFKWAKQMGGKEDEGGSSLKVGPLGNIYITGYFRDTVDFDPGPGTVILPSAGIWDIFIQKLDSSGNLIWVKRLGGSDSDFGWSIVVDDIGNVYTLGEFVFTVDFDPGPGTANLTSAGIQDVFVQKMDPSGNFLWAKRMGGTDVDKGVSIAIDPLANLYTTGFFKGTADFDPGLGTANLTSAGMTDIFVQKMDSSGNFIWAIQTGGTDLDIGQSITANDFGKAYTTGWFSLTVDFNPGSGNANFTSAGLNDIFIQKLGTCVQVNETISLNACNSYNSPSGKYTWTISNTYMDTISSWGGCDSVITIILTIDTVDLSVSQSGMTLTSNAAGATYQWLDCQNGFAIINGETNQSFTATASGTYAVEVNKNCIDTSACYSITITGITNIYHQNEIIIYPNPTNGGFSIDLGAMYNKTTIRISDLYGRIIHSNSFDQKQLLKLNNELTAGHYFLVIKSDDRLAVLRLIVD